MAQQQISLVRTQQASKQRELRMAQLTQTEVSALPTDTAVYEGVGKMYVASIYLSISSSRVLVSHPLPRPLPPPVHLRSVVISLMSQIQS